MFGIIYFYSEPKFRHDTVWLYTKKYIFQVFNFKPRLLEKSLICEGKNKTNDLKLTPQTKIWFAVFLSFDECFIQDIFTLHSRFFGGSFYIRISKSYNKRFLLIYRVLYTFSTHKLSIDNNG